MRVCVDASEAGLSLLLSTGPQKPRQALSRPVSRSLGHLSGEDVFRAGLGVERALRPELMLSTQGPPSTVWSSKHRARSSPDRTKNKQKINIGLGGGGAWGSGRRVESAAVHWSWGKRSEKNLFGPLNGALWDA